MLIELLQPPLVACGHMHRAHHEVWTHDNGVETENICLAHIRDREEAVAMYAWDGVSCKLLGWSS